MSGEQSGGRWICLSCRKIVTAKPIGRCEDCGGHMRAATDEDAACDRCGDEDGRRLLDRTWGVDRLCDGCIDDLGLRDGEAISDEDLVTDGGREQSGDRVDHGDKVPKKTCEWVGSYARDECGEPAVQAVWKRVDARVNEHGVHIDTEVRPVWVCEEHAKNGMDVPPAEAEVVTHR